MKPQIHATQKHAWIDGAYIQYKGLDGNWYFCADNSPAWDESTEYRASIAEVEGKPVFFDSVLFDKHGGQVTFGPAATAEYVKERCAKLSWNPPLPKTITIELLREDVADMARIYTSSELFMRFANACKEALK